MREILFKAKRKDSDEWVEGYYCFFMDTHCIVPQSLDTTAALLREQKVFIKVDPDTLCQYTGLKGKNGNRIWENDIVKDESVCLLGTVIWHCDDYVGWLLNDKYAECPQMMDKDMWEDCEVIGNIFDNPELLEPNTPTGG